MQKRVAKIAHDYAGVARGVGIMFDVEDQDVCIMLLAGLIEPMEGDPGYVATNIQASEPVHYQTRDMAADRTKRPYNRKAAQ